MSVEKMKMVDIIGHKNDLYTVAKQIVLSETVHMVNAFQEINSDNFSIKSSDDDKNISRLIDLCYIRPYSSDSDFSNVTRVMKKLREMCDITDKFTIKEEELINEKEKIENEVNTMAEKFGALFDKLKGLKRENEDLTVSLEKLGFLQNLQVPLQDLHDLSNFDMRIYKISSENALRLQDNYENLPSIITKIYENESEHYEIQIAFTPVLLKADADRVFKSVNYELIEVPSGYEGTPESVSKVIRDKISENEKTMVKLKAELDKLSMDNQRQVCLLQKSLELQLKVEEVKNYTACTNEFFYLAGWVPESLINILENRFKDYEDRLIIVNQTPEELGKDVKVPTQLKNNAFFRPFEAMVNVYGSPSYNELDPTKYVAITYMIIFGLMFGDLGQGLVLAMLGLYMVKKMGRPNLGGVLLRIGSMSAIVGIVYGSFFGDESVLPHLVNDVLHLNFKFIHPIDTENIMPVLGFAICFGVSLLIIAYVMNLINSIKRKDLENGLFGKNGLAGLILYVSVLLFAVVKLVNLPTIMSDAVWYTIFVVLLIITIVKQPLANALMHNKKLYKESAKDYYIEEGFGAFETLIGFISNTLSFIRIGAFAINHAGLFMAFTILGELLNGGKAVGIGGVLMFILGNAMLISLEALIVFIQGLRLQFYEFFGKYYEGSGIAFEPVTLDYDYGFRVEKKENKSLNEKKLVID